jgi:choline monooxygenase
MTPIRPPGLSTAALVDEAAAALARGLTPPGPWYHDPALYALERARIFGRAWQLVALTPDVQAPGSYAVVSADEREFVLVRDLDGRLRAFHNVCRHRAARLVAGSGAARLLQCR